MPKLRVYELAKELGIDSKTLMSQLSESGVYVRSPSTQLEPATVRNLRDRHGVAGPTKVALRATRESIVPPAPPARATGRSARRPAMSPRRPVARGRSRHAAIQPAARADAEAVFGEDLVASVLDSRTDSGYDWEWKRRLISYETFKEFVAHGFSTRDAGVAFECLSAGLTPADLNQQLGQKTVLGWLAAGHSAARVGQTLRECRADPRSQHLLGAQPDSRR